MPARLHERWPEYQLWSRQPNFQRRVTAATAIIQRALATDPGVWAVSCSGGKDSTALAALCHTAGWHGPILLLTYPETPAENIALVEQLAQHLDCPLHRLAVPGAWDVYAAAGRFFITPETSEERRLVRAMLTGYKRAIQQYVDQQGWAGQFLGLRQAESTGRRRFLQRYGSYYRLADRPEAFCCPLNRWTARDVWAYTARHALPYLSVYATARDPERERSEFTWLANEAIWAHGMAADWKATRPAIFEEWVQQWPDLQKYV